MDGYIQIGSTALRDPATGDFLPSVPLYIRAEDREKVTIPVICGEDLARKLADKFKEYKKAERAEKKKAGKKSGEGLKGGAT